MSAIDKESDDIFAKEVETDDEDVDEDFDEDATEEREDAEDELTAAVALTSLVGTECSTGSSDYKDSGLNVKVGDAEEEETEISIPQRFTKSGRKRAVSFPLKLLKVLSTKKHADVIAWTPSGKAFEIRKSKQFAVEILPKYFKSAKYSSFTRKLHRWSFQRHYRGDDAGAYYHPDFIKGRLDLVERMRCKSELRAASTPKPKASKPASPAARKGARGKARKKGAAKSPANQVQSRPTVSADASQVARSFPGEVPPGPVAQPYSAVAGLSAAMELEAARHWNERVSDAAFSRQALAMLERQQQQRQIQATLNALIERRYHALLSHQSSFAVASGFGTTLPLASALAPAVHTQPMGLSSSGRPADLAQLSQKFKPAPVYNYAFGEGAPALPSTNIQGARTA